MDAFPPRSRSLRPTRRFFHPQDLEGDGHSPVRSAQDHLKTMWRRCFVRLVFVIVIVWGTLIVAASLLHVWACHSGVPFFSALCRKDSKVLGMLATMGLTPKPLHRCSIPLADDPDAVVIPDRTPDTIVKSLSYIMVDEHANETNPPLFGGHQSWSEREESFKLRSSMKVHCGFTQNGGAEMDPVDVKYVRKCKFVVASGIFDGYDTPQQPTNISLRSQKLFCFLMVVDEISLDFIKQNVSIREDTDGGKWARYSIWIDGKMELIVDPLLMLERYLWRGKHTFAVAQHKHHNSIYEEADAIKRRKRYARPLIDLHMKIYRYEGMEPWSLKKGTTSDVPEGAVIIREHTAMTDLFSCLWFNEVDLFTPRDQLSFGYVTYRLGDAFKFFMFPNCEYNSLFILHRHTREHSSVVEWVKSLDEFKANKSGLRETRGGLGLWTPYPEDLESVKLPPVTRTTQAG